MLIRSLFLRRGHRNSYKTDIISLMQFTDKPSQSAAEKNRRAAMSEESRLVCFIFRGRGRPLPGFLTDVHLFIF